MKNTKARNLKIYKHIVISEKSFSTHMGENEFIHPLRWITIFNYSIWFPFILIWKFAQI